MDRIGTYKSEGAVKSISITEDSKLIIIGSAVNGIFVFHVETGEQITILPTNQLKQIEFGSGNKQFFLIHNAGSKVTIVDIFSLSVIDKKIDPDLSYNQAYDENDKKTLIKSDVAYTKGAWGYLNKTLILGTSRGAIDIYDVLTGTKIHSSNPHKEAITDLRFSLDYTLLISSSRDCYCKIYDSQDLRVIRSYNAQRPLNSAVISPLYLADSKYHAIIGGGQEIRDVTTTKNDVLSI